jgi:hypothetical protein
MYKAFGAVANRDSAGTDGGAESRSFPDPQEASYRTETLSILYRPATEMNINENEEFSAMLSP